MSLSSPLHAPFHADHCVQKTVPVSENTQIARDTFRLRFESAPIAESLVPGQFLMLRLSQLNDPLIGRPLAVFDVIEDHQQQRRFVDVVYVAKGKFTRLLALSPPGRNLDVWGPLGNGFSTTACDHLIMVAGGIGFTPFLAVAREALGRSHFGEPIRHSGYARRVTFCYGARTEGYLVDTREFTRLGVDVRVATDDGTRGHHGLVTDIARQLLTDSTQRSRIVCCGPEPMMEAVSHLAEQFQVACEVSLETPMACGIGICFTCVAKVRVGETGWDYKRTCVEGPVFDAHRILW